jgi:hypothetical protein
MAKGSINDFLNSFNLLHIVEFARKLINVNRKINEFLLSEDLRKPFNAV